MVISDSIMHIAPYKSSILLLQVYVNLFDCHQENITLPLAFIKHMNFLDFEESNKITPIYINMVRHPIDRVISWYYYIRQGWFSLKFEFQDLHPNLSPTLTWSYLLLKLLTKGIKDGKIPALFILQCWKSVEHFFIFFKGIHCENKIERDFEL